MRTPTALFVAALCACASAPEPKKEPAPPPVAAAPPPAAPLPGAQEKAPALRLPTHTVPLAARLSLQLDPTQPRLQGSVTYKLRLAEPRAVIFLHGRNLHVTSVTAGAQQGTWEQVDPDGMARVSFPAALPAGESEVTLAWDAAYDTQLSGIYLAKSNGEPYVFSQGESIGARRSLPCFDEPSFKLPWTVDLTVRASDVAVFNSLEQGEAPAQAGFKKVQFATTPPLPSYLLAFAVGPFDVVTTELPPNDVRKTALRVRGLAPKGRGKDLAWSLKAANELLPLLEKWMGIPYPYDKLDHIAVPDFTAGAMENPGAITYRETALLYRQGESSREREGRISETIAHEMAHMWFGDYVTLRWWTDTWLNESFATWMETRIIDEWRPDLRAGLGLMRGAAWAMGSDSLATARAIRQPVERTQDIDGQFDAITYQKGASVLAMFERWLGAENYRRGVQEYLKANANGGGSTDELLQFLGKAGGKDVATPMATFLNQPGVPLVKARVECGQGKATLRLAQERYFPVGSKGDASAQLWQIPVCARWEAKGTHEACTLLTAREGALDLGATCPKWVMPNAGAAGYYRWALEPKDLRALREQGMASLEVRERLSLADALSAALRSATLPAADVLAALEPVARDPDEAVSLVPLSVLGGVRERLIDRKQIPALERQVRTLYRPAATKLGWQVRDGEEPATTRHRSAVLGALAELGRDPEARKELAKRGRAYANAQGDAFDAKAVDPTLATLALQVAVEDGGAPLFDALVARLGKESSAEVRSKILASVGSVRDPQRAARALDLSLDPRLRRNERTNILGEQLMFPETRAQAWEWLTRNFDALAKEIPEQYAAGMLGAAARAWCDADDISRAETFLRTKTAQVPGADRALARGLEAARLCVALKDAQGPSATSFYARKLAAPKSR